MPEVQICVILSFVSINGLLILDFGCSITSVFLLFFLVFLVFLRA